MKDATQSPRTKVTLLRPAVVMEHTGLSRSALYREIAAGAFTPVKLGTRAVAFSSVEVEQWIADRIAAAQGDAV